LNSIKNQISALLFALIFSSYFLSSTPSQAEEAAFSVSATATGDSGDLTGNLQYQAVVEWLQRYLGNRFAQYQGKVTPEFAKRYILDYSIGHPSADRNQVVLSGHLDAEGLKKWVRVAEAKRGGSSLKVLFLLSSTLPGISLYASATATGLHDSQLAQTLYNESNAVFHKFSTRATPASNPKLSISQPPTSQTEMKGLQEYGISEGYNTALWIQLAPCKACNESSIRMDTYLYNLIAPRLALSRSDELPLQTADLVKPEKLRSAVHFPLEQFRSDLEDQASEGTLFTAAHRLIIEGIDSYRVYQQVESGISRMDFIDQSVLKRSEPKLAEFELLCSMKPDELYARLQQAEPGGFHLKPVRIDPQALVMRYSK